ncbi:hypothetical protein KIW84_025347 [Lathyrus oleraceus]|uniref:Uncharacterized protein n=1 Tax=Pisum sativum TaxID=3888 RepID=A0A9D4YIY8_PEA|nr:hypothetical protein KIW84_025347 [Pisum sativum]
MNYEAHREALHKVLEHAYVEHDVTLDQFDHIVAKITSCNNLSFCDEEHPKEGRNHNLALHISMNCKEEALSNVSVDTGSSLNVLPKSTLSRLSFQGALMRFSGMVVNIFDDSRKTVIGEVDLPVKIGMRDFQINFQVMDIQLTYNCLLGRPWIHEVGVVTSTLHQKMKFVKNNKLVVVGEEKALLVSHLSSFTYVDAEEEVGTPFQAFSFADELRKVGAPMSSLKDAQEAILDCSIDKWGRVVKTIENKNKVGLGFHPGPFNVDVKVMQPVFRSGGFIHENDQHSAAIIKDSDEDEACANFVTHGQTCNNWVVVDVSVVMHRLKLVLKPIKYNDHSPSPNFDFLVFEVEEEIDDEEVSGELSRLLEHKEKVIQRFEEHIELVILGSNDDVKEVKIGYQLGPEAKKGLIDLLRDYSDVFAWSYQDMSGLDSEIVEHKLSLKPECPLVKLKLRTW